MARFNTANSSYFDNNASTFDVVMLKGAVDGGASQAANVNITGGLVTLGGSITFGGLGQANNANSLPVTFATDAVPPRTPRTQKGVAQITRTSVTTSVTLVASQGVGNYADLFGIILQNSSATPTLVNISDGTNIYTFNSPATSTIQLNFDMDGTIPAKTANTPWTANTSSSVASEYITALYVLNTV